MPNSYWPKTAWVNSADLNQMAHNVASYKGLHPLPLIQHILGQQYLQLFSSTLLYNRIAKCYPGKMGSLLSITATPKPLYKTTVRIRTNFCVW